MKHILEGIIQLAEARNIEEEAITRKYDPDGLGISITNFAYIDEARPKGKELDDYLASLPKETLEYIAAVMYGGRSISVYGEEIPLGDLIVDMKDHKHLDDMIGEKTPLPDYLRAGIKLYKI
jgi:hypothetical protein